MTVYIEYAFIDNFIIDYLLLNCSLKIVGINAVKLRLFISSIFGALFAVLFPLFFINVTISSIFKILCSFILVVISSKFNSIKEYVFAHFIFLSLTFISGGFITAFFNVFNIKKTDISLGLIILLLCFILKAIERTVKKLYKRRFIHKFVYNVEITVNNTSVICKGFLDSGNGLYDGNTPIIVCGERFYKSHFKDFNIKKEIEIYTVSGEEKKIATNCDIKIYFKNEWNIFNNVLLCVSDKGLNSVYDIILHPALFKEREYEFISEDKKVS